MCFCFVFVFVIFFFKQKTAYEVLRSLVGSEMCIRDRSLRDLNSPILGTNFLYKEFVHSTTAIRQGIDNSPNEKQWQAIEAQALFIWPVSYTHLTLPTIYSV